MALGIPGDNTYSNYQEAARSLWRQTVLPLVNRLAKALSIWLGPASGGNLELRPDLDAIEALSSEREALWTRIDKATFLSADEKRAAVGYGAAPAGADLTGKANFNPGQLRDAIGRWAGDGGETGDLHQAARRGRGSPGTPAQEARLQAATAQARDAARRGRELDPTWQPPSSVSSSIQGQIAHQEAVARAAEARLAEITRDAVPNTNPSWGVNRLTKELHEQGYMLRTPAQGSGLIYTNPTTREQVRIMQRPSGEPGRSDPPAKYLYEHYYRYQPGPHRPWGSHIPIPDK